MDFSQITLFQMMQQRMRWLSERQAVLAKNIANANTPGYKPQDLKPLDFKAMMKGESLTGVGEMRATQPGHMKGGIGAGQSFAAIVDEDVTDTTPSGNAVVIEDELMKMQVNNLDYQATTGLYKKMASLVRTALGSRQ